MYIYVGRKATFAVCVRLSVAVVIESIALGFSLLVADGVAIFECSSDASFLLPFAYALLRVAVYAFVWWNVVDLAIAIVIDSVACFVFLDGWWTGPGPRNT